MIFPYEIRKVPAGQMVVVPDGENTVSWSAEYENPFAARPEDRFRAEGAQLPTLNGFGWIVHSVALSCPNDDRGTLLEMAKGCMEELPDLAHKFILVYHTDQYMFWNCFLVATDDNTWWREFEVIE